VLKLLALVIALIIAAMVDGAYLHFNPAIPIFVILGFGIYMVGRIGGPRLPDGSHAGFGNTYGIYLHREDFVPPDPIRIAAATCAMVSIRMNRKRVD
jgi:hypothetical protein